ncbi:Six-hairpin glycosidase-like protein [Mycena rebaudengoi]|nr:Six-hairpin glycosidase-like protein [Mycena rebaudengoi]
MRGFGALLAYLTANAGKFQATAQAIIEQLQAYDRRTKRKFSPPMAVQFYEYLATATANYGIRASDLGTKLAVAYGNKLRETKTACVGITLNQVFVDLFQQRDHYRFTQDKTFLQDVAYPFLREVTSFYECYAFENDGYNVTGPSLSPENSFTVPRNESVPGAGESVDIAPAMDGQLMTEIFQGLLEAASVLGIPDSDPTVAAARAFLPTIKPQQIGSLGQILEWRVEYTEPDPGHRHLSPLWALMPGRAFSPLINSTLFEAAQVLLDRRVSSGSGSTGWSRTWLIAQYARAFRGADAWTQLGRWFALFPPPYSLYNTLSGSTDQLRHGFGEIKIGTLQDLNLHLRLFHSQIFPFGDSKLVPVLNRAIPTAT